MNIRDRALNILPVQSGRLPDQGKQGVKIRLDAIEFTLHNHTLFRTITIAVFYDNMCMNAGLVFKGAGHMQFAGFNGKALLHDGIFHTIILALSRKHCKTYILH